MSEELGLVPSPLKESCRAFGWTQMGAGIGCGCGCDWLWLRLRLIVAAAATDSAATG